MMDRIVCWMVALVGQMSGVNGLRDAELSTNDYTRIVVIPDVHGDSTALLRSLWLAVMRIDGPTRDPISLNTFTEIFANAFDGILGPPISVAPDRDSIALIQLGDLVDRGPKSLACIDIMHLAEAVIGWRTFQLYGNHEVWNMVGTVQQMLHPDEIAEFGTAEERMRIFAHGEPLHAQIANEYLAMVRLTSPSGGSASTLFVHAGIDMTAIHTNALASINEINRVAQQSVTTSRETLESLMEGDSYLWTRSLADDPSEVVCDELIDPILAHFNVARIIVGHTPQVDRLVKERCGGKIILTDVMMSRWMFGFGVDPSSLENARPVAVVLTLGGRGDMASIVAHYTDLQTGTLDVSEVIYPPRESDHGDTVGGGAGEARKRQRVDYAEPLAPAMPIAPTSPVPATMRSAHGGGASVARADAPRRPLPMVPRLAPLPRGPPLSIELAEGDFLGRLGIIVAIQSAVPIGQFFGSLVRQAQYTGLVPFARLPPTPTGDLVIFVPSDLSLVDTSSGRPRFSTVQSIMAILRLAHWLHRCSIHDPSTDSVEHHTVIAFRTSPDDPSSLSRIGVAPLVVPHCPPGSHIHSRK